MIRDKKNIAESIHQRLLNKAKKSGRPFNELLQYYTIERFIFRLAQSPFEENYLLKGALMLLSNPVVFEETFASDKGKQNQWRAFIQRINITNAPKSFTEVIAVLKTFISPVTSSLADNKIFQKSWKAPGPWR